MAANPVFIGVPKTWQGQVTAANANRDGTGTLVTIATAGANGSRIDLIEVQAAVTTTAGMVRFFMFDGANNRLLRELAVAAITPSASVQAFREAVALFEGLVLPTGWSLKASTHNAEAMNIIARGGDF